MCTRIITNHGCYYRFYFCKFFNVNFAKCRLPFLMERLCGIASKFDFHFWCCNSRYFSLSLFLSPIRNWSMNYNLQRYSRFRLGSGIFRDSQPATNAQLARSFSPLYILPSSYDWNHMRCLTRIVYVNLVCSLCARTLKRRRRSRHRHPNRRGSLTHWKYLVVPINDLKVKLFFHSA